MVFSIARRLILGLALFCLCLIVRPPFAKADTQATYEAARKEGPMTWYISFYSQDLPAKAAAEFARLYPGLTVTPVRLTSGGIFQRQRTRYVCRCDLAL